MKRLRLQHRFALRLNDRPFLFLFFCASSLLADYQLGGSAPEKEAETCYLKMGSYTCTLLQSRSVESMPSSRPF